MTRKIGALFLAVCMMISATGAAMAVGGSNSDSAQDKPVVVIGTSGNEKTYATLYEAVNAAEDGDTISLSDNVEMGFFELDGRRTNPTMVVEGKSITLDGNGHTVTAKNEAFSMIEVRASGTITVKNIILDGSAADNRIYSNIINVEGGTAYIENGAVLKNNATNAVGIGTNVPGGKCIMNGGEITGGVVNTGGTDTGAAVTVLTDSTFIMNGGTISGNQSSTGASGIMVNRGGCAQLNGGTISGNTTTKSGMGSAVHIKGGTVDLTGTSITGNSGDRGAIYVTNHYSFDRKWNGIINISGGTVSGNENNFGIYLWSKGNIEGTAAYVKFSGAPEMEDYIWALANGYSNLDYKPIEVTGAFTPVRPIEVDSAYDYIVRQEIIDYAPGIEADNSQFIASKQEYGYQADKENNYLYTEAKRPVMFMDGDKEIEGINYWEFVEDYMDEPSSDSVNKEGYVVDGWYKDAELNEEWNFETDKLPRADAGTEFKLYVKWKEAPAVPDDGGGGSGGGSGSAHVTTDRIGGENRFETAVKVADRLKSKLGVKKFDTIIVADSDDFADALSAAPLASEKDAPILVVNERSEKYVKDYIDAHLSANGKVYIIGETAAVSEDFEESLEPHKVTRLGGADRYETNLKVLKELNLKGQSEIMVASGQDYPDALSASATGNPILLVKDSIFDYQKDYLETLGGDDDYFVIGGTAAVNEKIADQLKEFDEDGVSRVWGDDRYETAEAVANRFFRNARAIYIASGDDYPDALTGGVIAQENNAPLLLVNERNYSEAARFVDSHSVRRVTAIGGPAAVSDKVLRAVAR